MAEQSAVTQEKPKFEAPRKKRKWLKRLILLVVAAALVLFVLSRCMAGGMPGMSGAYLPATAQVQDMTVTVTGPGTIKPNDSYRATTLVKGEILDAPFDEGQTVHKDDTLFVIDAGNVESAIRQAENTVAQARDGVERAQAGVRQAQLSVESAQLNYDSLIRTRNDNTQDRQVKANATGVITKVYVDPGDNLVMGIPIADILDRDNMKLAVPFHSVNASGFYVGQSATVTVSGTAETLYGTISEIAATDSVGAGGALVRSVTITVWNPGALSNTSMGSAAVGEVSSAATGAFAYGESKQLVAKYSGELLTLTIKEGDRVFDGQLVGEFKEVDMQDQIDAAEINVKNARITLENAIVALKDAQISLKSAEDSLENAKDNLEDYTITSPIDGTVIEKNYKAGDNYDPSTASATGVSAFMAVIYDMSRLTFDINIDELDAPKVAVGQKVSITADALDGQSFTGTVDKVNINGTTINGKTTYPVTVLVDGSGEELAAQGLWPGMNVSANIIVEEVGAVLSIPVDAVQRGESPYVLVAGEGAVNENGELTDASKLEHRPVTLGRNSEELVEILSGLSEGETVFIQNNASSYIQTMMGM